jgi:hypothetical protein
VENNFIELVNSYKYLDSLIAQDGKTTKEIRPRIAQARTAFMNRKELLRFKKMSIHIRKRLNKVFVWSVALYGPDSWVNKAEERYLESFETWCWRRILRVGWTEFLTNDSVLSEIGEPGGLLRSIKERRWKLIGFTLRHEEELHHKILEGQIESKRGRGRPRTTL